MFAWFKRLIGRAPETSVIPESGFAIALSDGITAAPVEDNSDRPTEHIPYWKRPKTPGTLGDGTAARAIIEALARDRGIAFSGAEFDAKYRKCRAEALSQARGHKEEVLGLEPRYAGYLAKLNEASGQYEWESPPLGKESAEWLSLTLLLSQGVLLDDRSTLPGGDVAISLVYATGEILSTTQVQEPAPACPIPCMRHIAIRVHGKSASEYATLQMKSPKPFSVDAIDPNFKYDSAWLKAWREEHPEVKGSIPHPGSHEAMFFYEKYPELLPAHKEE